MSHLNPGTGLTIRMMTERDIDRVQAIATALPTAPQWLRADYEIAIAVGEGVRRIALIGEYDSDLVGFAIASVLPPRAEIESIAVEVKAQGFGFGSSLLQAMLQELKLAGVGEVDLEMRESSGQGMPGLIYRRAGFREVGRRREYYRNPLEDAVLLRLRLIESPELKLLEEI
jgi:ribosomal-protein-alanine N-acetyltransferase